MHGCKKGLHVSAIFFERDCFLTGKRMGTASTRRDFLKLSAIGLAATATAEMPAALENEGSPAKSSGKIEVWVTDEKLRCAQVEAISWRPASGQPSASAIVLNPNKKFQTILGFGAAFTDAACYMFAQLSPTAQEHLFHEMFHPSAMGLNVCRTCMGASDYSTKAYSYDEGDADPELKHFSIDHDREYILPMLRLARRMNPELFVFSSPWSPPGWMKSGGSLLGGSMRRRYLSTYAEYFVRFLQAYAAEGVPVDAVTPQNEVDTDQDGRMPACIWPQEYEIEFVRQLGPLLLRNGLSTKIWILDHNYNLWGRAICELEDPGLRQYCKAVAWHGYAGEAGMMSKVHDAYPDVEMHWTEGGPDYTSPGYLTDWTQWGRTFTEALRNWCQSVTGWNLALDEKGRPNIGPFPCGGVVTIHSQTKEITRSGQYWAFAQFSRFIRRGAQRFDSQSTLKNVDHVGVENPDGRRVLALTNSEADRAVTLRMGGMQAQLNLTRESVTTLVWA
jgi:glucosylceramidase